MKKSVALFIVLALSIAMLAGCGGGSSDDYYEPPVEDIVTPADDPSDIEEPYDDYDDDVTLGELDVNVINSTGYGIISLEIIPSGGAWLGNQLYSSVADGDSYIITAPESVTGEYDIRVSDDDEDTYVFRGVRLGPDCDVDIAWDSGEVGATVTLLEGETSYTAGRREEANYSSGGEDIDDDEDYGAPISMELYNRTIWAFTGIYIYRAGTNDVGMNLSEEGTIYTDDYIYLTVDGYSSYNIELIDEDGSFWTFGDVYLEDGCVIEVDKQADAELHVTYESGVSKIHIGDIQ